MEFDKEKFKSVLSYIINRCENKKNVEKTWFVNYYIFQILIIMKKYETSITNETYYRDPEYSVREYDNWIPH